MLAMALLKAGHCLVTLGPHWTHTSRVFSLNNPSSQLAHNHKKHDNTNHHLPHFLLYHHCYYTNPSVRPSSTLCDL